MQWQNNTSAYMKNRPLITIATVTYNAGATLQRTLQSVACQDYPRIEHLIVDGRSRDDTLPLVQRYVEQNTMASVPHSIRLVCEHDQGLYDAMNKAIRQATGEYIVFLNAGDKLHTPQTITRIVDSLDWIKGDYSNPAIAYGETDIVDEEGRFIRHRRLQAPEKLDDRSFLDGMLVCHQSFYVRTDLAREEPYNLSYRYSADYDWCLRLIRKARKRRLQIINTHQVLTDYLNEGLTTRNHHRSLLERLRIMAVHYGWPSALLRHAWFVVRAVYKA